MLHGRCAPKKGDIVVIWPFGVWTDARRQPMVDRA
jgi:hypothetical protein